MTFRHRSPLSLALVGLAVVLAAAVAYAAPARAAGPEIGVSDDQVLTYTGGAAADRAIAEWKQNGVDNVRIVVRWNLVAPGARSTRRPAGFNPNDPNQYAWALYDAAVNRAVAAGMTVSLVLTGPAPYWATQQPRRRNGLYLPSPKPYGQVAAAAASHFRGRLERLTLWNEPNIQGWLSPQNKCRGRRCTPVAPHTYRNLVRAAYPAVKRVDRSLEVSVGALAPKGSNLTRPNATERPLVFLRAMGCVNSRLRKIRSGACKRYKPFRADTWSHHPHGLFNAPDQPFRNRDEVDIASLPRLERVLDRLQRLRRFASGRRGRLALILDEYAYQTNPPDRIQGISLRRQDRWMQQGAYIAWKDPRVRNLTQYQWYDEPYHRRRGDWQSGVRFVNGRAKPSLRHFDTPFFVDRRAQRVWGQIRPGGRHVVEVQRRIGKGKFRRLRRVRTDSRGYYAVRTRMPRNASFRFRVVS
jgi:hypothetical protein